MTKSFVKRWPCENCKREVGEIFQDNRRVGLLSVFRSALRPGDPPTGYAVEDLAAGVVICSACGHRQKWRLSNRLLKMAVQAS
jgi:hypothetical protein